MADYGRVLRAKRTAMGLTQAELGKIVGCTGSTISQVENDIEVRETTLKAIKSEIRKFEDRLSGTALANYKITIRYEMFCTAKSEEDRRRRLHELQLATTMALLDMDRNKDF